MATRDAAPALLFREQQHFTQLWLWLVVAAISGLQWWGFIQQIVFRRPFGTNPEPDWLAVLTFLLFGIGLPWLMWSCQLITEVRSDALYVRYVPFHRRPVRIGYDMIASSSAVRYSPLLDYGGWGIRFGRGGRAYNVSGNLGARLELVSGRHLLIGSRYPNELAQAIAQAAVLRPPVS